MCYGRGVKRSRRRSNAGYAAIWALVVLATFVADASRRFCLIFAAP
jgi:hypothetical protein